MAERAFDSETAAKMIELSQLAARLGIKTSAGAVDFGRDDDEPTEHIALCLSETTNVRDEELDLVYTLLQFIGVCVGGFGIKAPDSDSAGGCMVLDERGLGARDLRTAVIVGKSALELGMIANIVRGGVDVAPNVPTWGLYLGRCKSVDSIVCPLAKLNLIAGVFKAALRSEVIRERLQQAKDGADKD